MPFLTELLEYMDIKLSDIHKSFGGKKVLDGVSLTLKEGEILCIMGPSGCGKTTLLNVIAGLVKPDSGSISGADGGRMAYVFQEARLLPWKTVAGNVALVLPDSMPVREAEARIVQSLEAAGLADAAELMPQQLSGGMAIRASLARALASNPEVLLLDEAFASLDRENGERIIERLKAMSAEKKMSIVAVTHSEEECRFWGGNVFRFE